MRQIFTSQRVETVEGVAKLLEDAGIETYISNGRSYHGQRGSQFKYSAPIARANQPTVWVRHADDQPRAREILREQGLLDSTRPGQSYVMREDSANTDSRKKRSWALRFRLILLALIVAAATFTFLRYRALPHQASTQERASSTQQQIPSEYGLKEDEQRVRILPPPAQSP